MRRLAIAILFVTTGWGYRAAAHPPVIRYIMPGQQVKLSASPLTAPRYQWYRNGASIEGAVQQEFVTSQPGVYAVEAFNEGGCVSELSDPVVIELITNSAEADVAISKSADQGAFQLNNTMSYHLQVFNNGPGNASALQIADQLPSQVLLDLLEKPSAGKAEYNVNAHTVLWKIDELPAGGSATLSIRVKIQATGRITNTATVTAMEKDPVTGNNSSTHQLEVLPLFIPNAITPNGDGVNDKWVIEGLEKYAENELTILNRWGNHVFEQKGYAQNWSGQGLNDGTYFYLLRVKDSRGQWQEFKGYITLLRP
ncbi:conserved repeat domain-containing protein/gliding motility-associated C-terminal domain-containing protein [Chitinophaga terrae (ex Kim and Jung 2007)]|uniref:Conserved repeat domain-containing protein/gliding motility-associated C-terminal domain-containing protein n=1 Tax=Chitinophaga terrae (ex Kim and Jung 2007) TaxID=408074 RepID=A0A1H3Y7T1_9BACT|nr:gliding motility-associated C-terminal domain-containing protein [Chitinophaga terrae (ex Kim and Jung 2007)]GEP90889.1 hypothetical protein CTE07_25340 [Chitinophaga terrae (ex Kim and Jung 2007)]SEA07623.1 conserved repeat domain-containing protein/gliding motility-associated C-terminal domain-containing protein [Chitinophaga terrae (ex Kim and Jung 2007)]